MQGDGKGLSWFDRVAPWMQSKTERSLPVAIQEALFGTIMFRASNLLTVASAFVICGISGSLRHDPVVYSVFAFLGGGLIFARVRFIVIFRKRALSGRPFSLNFSVVVFGVLGVVTSACWGAICLIAIGLSDDATLVTITALSNVGTAGAVAARNCATPRVTKAMLAASLLPLALGSLLASDHGFRLLLLLVPAMTMGLFLLIDERCQQMVELFLTQRKLSSLSNLDPLTQLSNRRRFDDVLAQTAALSATTKTPFALLMIDVDYFKAFNDKYGHPVGDRCLQQIAESIGAHSRGSGDLVARYGGEEFVVLLDGADGAEAERVAERLREAVTSLSIPHESRPDSTSVITISLGSASTEGHFLPVETLVDQADRALYRAKESGRNRVARFA